MGTEERGIAMSITIEEAFVILILVVAVAVLFGIVRR